MRAFLLSLLGPRFWLPAYAALAAALVAPGDYDWLKPAVPVCLGGILFFAALRMPFAELGAALRDPRRWLVCAGMAAAKLALLPALSWAALALIAPAWAAGVTLVMLMPAGLSSVALTDLLRGDRAMALFLIALSSALAPLTVPAGMALVHPGPAPGPAAFAGQALYILLVLALPFAAAQAARALAPRAVAAGMDWWGRCSIACLIIMTFVGCAANRHGWAGWPATAMLAPLVLVCLAAGLTLAAALLARRWLPAGEATAFACGALYVNNGLSIVYATAFHPGEAHMVLPGVLMQVPMVATVVLWGRWARR